MVTQRRIINQIIKTNFEIICELEYSTYEPTFWLQFEAPDLLAPPWRPRPFLVPKYKKNKIHNTYNFLCSSDRYRSLEFRDLFKFENGQKVAELWPKTYAHTWAYTIKLAIFGP